MRKPRCLTSLGKHQSGIAHLGLILIIASVVTLIGITGYAVTHKRHNAGQAADAGLDTVDGEQATSAAEFAGLKRDDGIDINRCDQLGRVYSTDDNACIQACQTGSAGTGKIAVGLLTKQSYCDKSVATDVDEATCANLHRVWLDDGCAKVPNGVDTEGARQCAAGYTYYDVKEGQTSSLQDTCYVDKAAATAAGIDTAAAITETDPMEVSESTGTISGGGHGATEDGDIDLATNDGGAVDGILNPGAVADDGSDLTGDEIVADDPSTDSGLTGDEAGSDSGDSGDSDSGDSDGGDSSDSGDKKADDKKDDGKSSGGSNNGSSGNTSPKVDCGKLNRKSDGKGGCGACTGSNILWQTTKSGWDKCDSKTKCTNSTYNFSIQGGKCIVACKSSSYQFRDSSKPESGCKLKPNTPPKQIKCDAAMKNSTLKGVLTAKDSKGNKLYYCGAKLLGFVPIGCSLDKGEAKWSQGREPLNGYLITDKVCHSAATGALPSKGDKPEEVTCNKKYLTGSYASYVCKTGAGNSLKCPAGSVPTSAQPIISYTSNGKTKKYKIRSNLCIKNGKADVQHGHKLTEKECKTTLHRKYDGGICTTKCLENYKPNGNKIVAKESFAYCALDPNRDGVKGGSSKACNGAKDTKDYKAGIWCSNLSKSECGKAPNYRGKDVKWQYANQYKNGVKTGSGRYICNVVGL